MTLVTFIDSQGIIHKKFVPPGQTVSMQYYVEVLSRVVQRIRQVRPQFQGKGSRLLLHDNARPHTAASIKQFLAKQEIPYSPDLYPPDFFLFPKIKSTL
jgi:hypothetical protein